MTKRSVIECDKELEIKLSMTVQHAITGQTVWYSDSLTDLVNRHCPEVYDIAKEAGFVFIPSSDPSELTYKPPRIWFDVIREPHLN